MSNKKFLLIEMELAKYSLRELINEKNVLREKFSKKELKKICLDLLENLFYLHSNNIAVIKKFSLVTLLLLAF